jgi:hypothetical protein
VFLASLQSVFGDPVWTSVAAVAAIVAIVVAVYVYRNGRPRKVVSYRSTASPVVSINADMANRVVVSLDGKGVRQVHVVTATVANVGNTPIERSDFEGPLSLRLGTAGEAISAEVGDTVPDSLEPKIAMQGHEIVIEPLLLNPGDSFAITALVSDYRGPTTVLARISGVTGVVREAPGVVGPAMFAASIWRRGFPVILFGIAAAGTVLSLIGILSAPNGRTQTRVVLRSGESLCGKELGIGAVEKVATGSALVLQLGDGAVRELPIRDVRSIKDDAC